MKEGPRRSFAEGPGLPKRKRSESTRSTVPEEAGRGGAPRVYEPIRFGWYLRMSDFLTGTTTTPPADVMA